MISAKLSQLLEDYRGVLLDSFGVLIDGAGALPGARDLCAALANRSYLVVTNDASRLPVTTSRRYRALGIEIPADRILTAGMLIVPYFEEHGLSGARTLVLGTADSAEYVRRAGGEVAPIDPHADYDVIVVADDDGYDFLAGVDAALTTIARCCDRGTPPRLLLPNPDIIYPKGPGQLGFTSGGVAALLECGLRRRLGAAAPSFVPLGKPNSPIFREAQRRLGDQLLMVGDQLETDIAGAAAAGIDTALLRTGISRSQELGTVTPTHILDQLWP